MKGPLVDRGFTLDAKLEMLDGSCRHWKISAENRAGGKRRYSCKVLTLTGRRLSVERCTPGDSAWAAILEIDRIDSRAAGMSKNITPKLRIDR